jgi:hypothetical protein
MMPAASDRIATRVIPAGRVILISPRLLHSLCRIMRSSLQIDELTRLAGSILDAVKRA